MASEQRADVRKWVIYRTQTHTTVYTGIEAETRNEALGAFLAGDGEPQPDREQWSEWIVDAVDVAE